MADAYGTSSYSMPTVTAASAVMSHFEEEQARLKQQIINIQTANVSSETGAIQSSINRYPSFDSLLPPLNVSISREVSWDKDLNGPGERAPLSSIAPIVGPLFPSELVNKQAQQREEPIFI